MGRAGHARPSCQLDMEAAFDGQFDWDYRLDNIGWNGSYGFLFAHRFVDRFDMQLGYKHSSAHVGDEYMERAGRRHQGCTREEIPLGWVWRLVGRFEVSAEAGWDFKPRR